MDTQSLPPSLGSPAGTARERANILIVDDEPKNLTVLETVLDDPGYRLVRAGSGQEALLALMAEEFAVLVLDVRMPGMTGFELALMVKERRKTAGIPIIFLTAYYNEDQHVLEGYGTGAVDYLHKPVNAAVLRSKVSVFAALYRQGRALEVANQALLAEVRERRLAEARLTELAETLERRVTERTEALRASESLLRNANTRKDDFLATLAHELRNPLAPVRNAAQLLRGGALAPAKLAWALGVIDRQVQAMGRLIDDLMDVSRINRGKIELRKERIDVLEVLREAIDATRPLIDECRHTLVLDLPAHPLMLDADPTRLAQAFMNLLNNAAKYMDAGGRIEVRVREEGADIFVAVQDAGIGIPGDRLETIFEMFAQVETALSRSRGGLGIGLSLAQRLVELHGGRVAVRSEGPGRGSEFEVCLPLAEHRRENMAGAPAQPAEEGAGPGLRILVADDNRDAAITLAELLSLTGHTVEFVHDGEAALELVARFDPQVALLDIGMPRLNGYEVCRRLRSGPGGTSRTLVAITGWGQPEDRRKAQEAGFDHHLVKPVDPLALEALLARLQRGA